MFTAMPEKRIPHQWSFLGVSPKLPFVKHSGWRVINSLDQLMRTWTNLGTQSCHPLMGSQIRETVRVIAPGRFRTGDLREEKTHKFQSLNIRLTPCG